MSGSTVGISSGSESGGHVAEAPVLTLAGVAGAPPPPLFCPGDRVMVSPYGIGVVRETCWRLVAGQQQNYYAVEFPHSSSRAFVPVSGPGVRPALSSHDTLRLLERLQEGRLTLLVQWSARQRQVTEILSSADPFELAALTGELRRWNRERGLPDLDRQAFRQAIKLLQQEVQGLDDEGAVQVRALLEAAWNEGPQ